MIGMETPADGQRVDCQDERGATFLKKNFHGFNAAKTIEVLPPKILGVGVQPVQPYRAVLG